jgi:hypothetical protein
MDTCKAVFRMGAIAVTGPNESYRVSARLSLSDQPRLVTVRDRQRPPTIQRHTASGAPVLRSPAPWALPPQISPCVPERCMSTLVLAGSFRGPQEGISSFKDRMSQVSEQLVKGRARSMSSEVHACASQRAPRYVMGGDVCRVVLFAAHLVPLRWLVVWATWMRRHATGNPCTHLSTMCACTCSCCCAGASMLVYGCPLSAVVLLLCSSHTLADSTWTSAGGRRGGGGCRGGHEARQTCVNQNGTCCAHVKGSG